MRDYFLGYSFVEFVPIFNINLNYLIRILLVYQNLFLQTLGHIYCIYKNILILLARMENYKLTVYKSKKR